MLQVQIKNRLRVNMETPDLGQNARKTTNDYLVKHSWEKIKSSFNIWISNKMCQWQQSSVKIVKY